MSSSPVDIEQRTCDYSILRKYGCPRCAKLTWGFHFQNIFPNLSKGKVVTKHGHTWPITLALLLFTCTPKAFAHAILIHSTPADHAVVHSRNVSLTLDYNSRIDAARSTLALIGPAGTNLPLQKRSAAKPSELSAVADNLASGTYHIHWQVLASDGHITRGEIVFKVAAN